MWRHVASNAFSLFILLMLFVAGMAGYAQSQFRADSPLETAVCVEVERGSNLRQVSRQLAADGVVTSEVIFRLGANYSEKADDLKAGSYLVEAHASMQEVLDIITRGGASTCGTEIVLRVGVTSSEMQVRELDPATSRFEELAAFALDEGITAPAEYDEARQEQDTRYRIALAEGVTSWQILNALSQVDFLSADVTQVPAEGTLAPDSYEVTAGSSVSALIEEMERRQSARLDAAWSNRVDGLPYDTKEEALVMASIIEKETGVPEERRQVASVFVNRLKQRIRLQTDPTVIYGITKGQGVLGRGLRQSELRGETPYNTYVIDGLPPTPIANPGLASIEAAMNPAETSFLFFVADGTGGHAFAETLAEHNANVAKWREIEASTDN